MPSPSGTRLAQVRPDEAGHATVRSLCPGTKLRLPRRADFKLSAPANPPRSESFPWAPLKTGQPRPWLLPSNRHLAFRAGELQSRWLVVIRVNVGPAKLALQPREDPNANNGTIAELDLCGFLSSVPPFS